VMAHPQQDRSQETLAAIADELGALENAWAAVSAPWEQRLKRMEALRITLRAACPVAPQEEWTVEGARFVAVVGAAGKQRTIDVRKLVRAIGARAFHKFASCTLKDLEAQCDPETVADVIATSQTGPRRIVTQEKGTQEKGVVA
jgi:hypothetical protein